ncbi:GTPase [Sulfolobus sp. A20]|uniref:PRK13768 family protein n=1 Tax=Saccharolobus sp. A20 TaxID=1891280 RepID=UPI000845C729|nr:ATP/GTP-binding protein [Sulfolobus sp. A20]TRM75245.1 GTPase [Sulfolobus sp. E5]TRM77196.1 GTPase [Sulfolobus sp. A20-N-F8]TRM80490.1 GTPase [Sulfolobus sp. D5]TRM85432.1 GTPase [Sulfolobus sp. F3]TRN02584.1 GTPase [Sulfolobus sp. F1]
MYFIFILGTAGSGKTILTKTLQEYLLDNEMDTAVINLDPAVESLPYRPDFDVRDYVDAFEVMERYNLGPNSALIASVDLILTRASEIKSEIDQIEANYVIVDTPGQIELFAYRDTGRIVSQLITGNNKSLGLFLFDSYLAKEARSFISLLLLSSSIKFRLNIPIINVLSKADLLKDDELNKILSWSENAENLIDELGKIDEYSIELVNLLLENLSSPIIPVSSEEGKGYDELYASIQRVVAGGEDYLTEEPNPRL